MVIQNRLEQLIQEFAGFVEGESARLCRGLPRNYCDDDLKQEGYLAIIKYSDKFGFPFNGTSNGYAGRLRHAIHWAMMDYLRKSDIYGRRRSNGNRGAKRIAADVYDDKTTLKELIFKDDEKIEIDDFVETIESRLNRDERRLFHLRVVEGLTYDKIGIMLGTSESTICLRFNKLRKRLYLFVDYLNGRNGN